MLSTRTQGYLDQGLGSVVRSSLDDGVEGVRVGARPSGGTGKIEHAGAERLAAPAELWSCSLVGLSTEFPSWRPQGHLRSTTGSGHSAA